MDAASCSILVSRLPKEEEEDSELSLLFDECDHDGVSPSITGHSQSQYRERRERGLFVVRLCQRSGLNAETLSRCAMVIEERARAWERIAHRANRRFPALAPLTVEQAKKLFAYHRRRVPSSKEVTAVDQLERADREDVLSDDEPTTTPTDECNKIYMQDRDGNPLSGVVITAAKKKRGRLIVQLIDEYGGIRDRHSRSQSGNIERQSAWQMITKSVNARFPELPPLKTEQCKKIHSHYRRKLTTATNNSQSLILPKSSSTVTAKVVASRPLTLPSCYIRSRKKHLLPKKLQKHGRPLPAINSLSGSRSQLSTENTVAELVEVIRKKDAEINRLKSELLQKSVDHELKSIRVLEKMTDLVRTMLSETMAHQIAQHLLRENADTD